MKKIENKLFFFFKDTNHKLNMTDEDEEHFQSNDICWLCDGEADDKVRDHCHLTGKYRGPACNSCNLNAKKQLTSFVPVYFHN